MATDLGKVGMVTKGAWSNSSAYEVLDVVTYGSGLYVAKQAVPAGTLPTNTTYWQTAISADTVLDGFKISMNTAAEGNMLIKYLGNRTSFKLTGNFANSGQMLIYAGYPYISGGGVNLRGIWAVDNGGNIKEMTSIGATLPTVTLNSNNTEMTITLPFTYAYLFILSTFSCTLSVL